jgi:sugar/nucleoside kinase (ribokinase family)
MNILVVGSVALDSIETPFGKVENALGGSAVHFSCAASFFTKVALVGVVGKDFPREHLDFLEQKGVDLRGLKLDEGKTFRWKGYYEYDLNQAHTLDTKLNVFENFRPHLPEEYKEIDFVFLANIDPELQQQVLKQTKKPKLTCCDTMNFWIENKPQALMETLQLVDIAIMNDSEAREFCRTFSLLDASRKILALGPQAVVFKKGEHGALMFTDSTHFSAPAFPLEEIKDPTGAGDSFAGGFIGYLAKTGDLSENNIRRAVIYGSVMASFNVEGFGLDRLRNLTHKEIEERYELFRKITVF